MTLPLIPAPRAFHPSGPRIDPTSVRLVEEIVPGLDFHPGHVPEEAYELELNDQRAVLRATTDLGLLRGRTTWAHLRTVGSVPAGRIEDEPFFRWRGLMLDVSRHFYPVPEVKRVLDRMAALKLNRFHWHLVDDQGWRLEIAGYPRFAEVGGATGYYTADQVAEVVRYANDRGIIVVPEIELPGHSMAALASYPELSCTGAPEVVATQWGILDGVYCASSEPAAHILEAVLAEVCRLFPGPWIHIGGDEVVRDRWEACPRCQDKIRREGLGGTKGLEGAFFDRFLKFVLDQGKVPIGWNELFEHRIPTEVPVQWWHRSDLAQRTLRAGNPLITSPIDYNYFDYPYRDSDPWFDRSFMLITPIEKVYSNPVVPPGCEPWLSGVWGGEACLWTERVPPSEVEQRIGGRLEAFAEVYWTFDRRPGWQNFSQRLSSSCSPERWPRR